MLFGKKAEGSNGKEDGKKKFSIDERNRLVVYIVIAAVLLVVALVSLLAVSFAGGVGTCGGKIFIQSKYSCYLYYAEAGKNASICDGLAGTYAYECMTAVADDYSAISFCNAINNSGFRDQCVVGIGEKSDNITSCTTLDEPDRSMCAYSIAEKTDFAQLGYCNAIGNTTEKGMCDSIYYYKDAGRTGNISECGYLTNKPNSTVLEEILLAESNSTAALDELFSSNFYGNESAYYNATGIGPLTPYGYCYSNVARTIGNESLCSALNGTSKALCEGSFANVTRLNYTSLQSSCADAPAEFRGYCVAGLVDYKALETRNVTLCQSINQSSLEYSCMADLAQKYNNETYCSYITNSTVMQSCYLYFNSNAST